MKLKKAAQTTAVWGVSTRVVTTVAMELAASWKPLRKSNSSASPSSSQTGAASCVQGTVPKCSVALSRKCMSAALDDDLGDDHGNALAGVHGLLQPAVQLPPFDQQQNLRRVAEQQAVAFPVDV